MRRASAGTDLLVRDAECGLLGAAASPASPAHDKKIPAARWDEETPGCTFSQGPDGKLRYGMSLADVAMVVAVDAQELEKVHRRHEPFFAVLLEVRHRGGQMLEVKPDKITLEFVQHFQVDSRRSIRTSSRTKSRTIRMP